MAYLPLSTANLPDPAINPAQGSSPADYFGAVLYTGNNATQSIDVGFATDFTWIKVRNVADNHFLYDNVRGATKYLSSDTTSAEGTIANGLTSFTSTGFNLGDSGSTNNASNNFAAWNWKANGSGVSNTDGSITSTVSANTESGFSIVSYTGNGTAGATVGHGLSSVPDMVIAKDRDDPFTGNAWPVYHTANGATKVLYLEKTNSVGTSSVIWNNTEPTTSVFSLGSWNGINKSGDNYIAYCFHSVEGFSKFGSYTGNGSTDGPFVYTGFRPAFVMTKATNSTQSWVMVDNERAGYNVENYRLFAESSNAESTTTPIVDLLSNGFKWRNNFGNFNGSGTNYIYMAFAENPFKYSNAR